MAATAAAAAVTAVTSSCSKRESSIAAGADLSVPLFQLPSSLRDKEPDCAPSVELNFAHALADFSLLSLPCRACRPKKAKKKGRTPPPEEEMEAFFAAAESGVARSFAAKYNYDVVKDAPMDGRYEWVRVRL
ncbi:hypothetical protein QYE76_005719 [Lolium multiflorum]|uniref:Cyclin-dependent kinase inhibitor domain-containing protein n=1 Tax=Lolium multiflorum TaxID=4521 RepID=A0AAD8RUK5_LOLMU|nr:hypothetical protein QYE76_005719 [Lolium multiflorum]